MCMHMYMYMYICMLLPIAGKGGVCTKLLGTHTDRCTRLQMIYSIFTSLRHCSHATVLLSKVCVYACTCVCAGGRGRKLSHKGVYVERKEILQILTYHKTMCKHMYMYMYAVHVCC